MSDGGQKKRKSKGWYKKQAFHNKRLKTDGKPGHRLVAGLKGFIVTCNEHERDAVKESYNILNEYADKLYGPEVIHIYIYTYATNSKSSVTFASS